MSRLRAGLILAAALVAAASGARAAPAGSETNITVESSGYGGEVGLPVGGSRVLRFAEPIGRVMVGDPKVADVVALSDRTIYVLAKGAGSSSLLVMPKKERGRPLAALDLRVGFDITALSRALSTVLPGEAVTASVQGDGIVLSGLVSSSEASARAEALASRYAPDKDKVVNLLHVRAAEQVMLSVHVSEVQRSALRQFGITSLAGWWTDTGRTMATIPALASNPEAYLAMQALAKIGKNTSIEGMLEALETKGYATTLAEPTLTALSGETAQFFAGGEFPVPVPQLQAGSATNITVEFKPYGVMVNFTPTVIGDTINLLVAPEVSALDKSNEINLQGFRIPGLITRRAKTTVELRNGQSFAIAGLIQRDFSNTLRGLPGAASLPVFGALFRSTSFQNNETEVVIVVTVHLAQPTDGKDLLLPTDTSQAASGEALVFGPTTDQPTPTGTRNRGVNR